MKINDKHLALYASSAPIDKEGYLNKRGEINKAFQKRWFVLIGNLLFYYEKKGDFEPVGVIVLEGFLVELVENADRYAFVIDFPGNNGRTYVFSAETQAEMEDWMRVMTCSSYEYMKSTIKHLQSQLDEIIACEKKTTVTDVLNRKNVFTVDPLNETGNNSNNNNNLENLQNAEYNFTTLHNKFKPFFVD